MHFSSWIEGEFSRPGESKSRTLIRLCAETGLGYTTVYRLMRGAPPTHKTILRLISTSGGKLTAESFGPRKGR